jgi:hypothetical protein
MAQSFQLVDVTGVLREVERFKGGRKWEMN